MTKTPYVVDLIREGMARSPTFAGLAGQLLAFNVLATVEPVANMTHGLRGYMQFVARTPARRYLQIYFDFKLSRRVQIATIGHELRHVLEVAGHPEVVDAKSLARLYSEIGHVDRDRCDSEGGRAAGRIIYDELGGRRAAAVSADR